MARGVIWGKARTVIPRTVVRDEKLTALRLRLCLEHETNARMARCQVVKPSTAAVIALGESCPSLPH